jgi:hypothetical protein
MGEQIVDLEVSAHDLSATQTSTVRGRMRGRVHDLVPEPLPKLKYLL